MRGITELTSVTGLNPGLNIDPHKGRPTVSCTMSTDALRAVASECQAAATGFSDEQAAEGLAVTDALRAIFLARLASLAASTLGYPAAETTLLLLPPELLSVILSTLDTRSLARLAATCGPLWLDAPTPVSGTRDIGLVEAELRRRAETRGLEVRSTLPEGSTSWVPYLLQRDRCGRQVPLAAGLDHSIFVGKGGRLLTCGKSGSIRLLAHAVDPDADLSVRLQIGPPSPVPSMQDRRVVSVATSGGHCLALSAEGEAYSWGNGYDGALGHADENSRAVPSRIESLSRIVSIAVGFDLMSAAVDEDGKLFTWGRAAYRYDGKTPNSLGYALDVPALCQRTPKWVEALSQDRVVDVALGLGSTLVVTDTGAVFSFGSSHEGVLGHGSLKAEVLPRRIEALTQMGRRFVAVAAGYGHAVALTEEGELYGWGHGQANGHGREERTPHRVAALIGQRVKHVTAGQYSSCAVTEKGELFTWSSTATWRPDHDFYELGHGVDTPQATPKRVEGLVGVRVAAVAFGACHTLAADEDGVVWAFGRRSALGLDDPNPAPVMTPTLIPTVRVRA